MESKKHLKRYSAAKYLENLRDIILQIYVTYTCVNNALSDFMYISAEAIKFIAPVRRIKVKANSKLWFNQIMSAMQRRDKFYKSPNILS